MKLIKIYSIIGLEHTVLLALAALFGWWTIHLIPLLGQANLINCFSSPPTSCFTPPLLISLVLKVGYHFTAQQMSLAPQKRW